MKRIAFKTLGCKVNQYETQAIRERLLEAGFNEVKGPADVYVINTCTVTHRADADSRRFIRVARKENPNSTIIVTGCYVELDKEEIQKIADNLLIIKNSDKNKILQYLVKDSKQGTARDAISRFEGRTKAFVKIQDGCDNFCSYCKVPLVRGRSRSRQPEEVMKEIAALISNNYKEVVLCGICLGDWGRDIGLELSSLLREIEDGIKGEFRVRLSSIEPWYVTSDLLQTIGDSKRICHHLHIPMQSGDDDILGRMNRNFKAADFLSLINRSRSVMPQVAFTTDILIGFPREGERHFNNTVNMVESTRPSRVHIFPFSMRKGTPAELFSEDVIPTEVINERASRLRAITDRLAIEYKTQFIGRHLRVLVETERDKRSGLLTGFTDTYIKTAFQGPDELKGQFAHLTLTNANSYDILAPHLSRLDTPVISQEYNRV